MIKEMLDTLLMSILCLGIIPLVVDTKDSIDVPQGFQRLSNVYLFHNTDFIPRHIVDNAIIPKRNRRNSHNTPGGKPEITETVEINTSKLNFMV